LNSLKNAAPPLLDLKLHHLQAMTDRVGLIQHATYSTPNLRFGYCTDDNARALLVVTQAAEASPGMRDLEHLSGVYFRFLQAALKATPGSLRNLLGADGKWADEAGPGDSPGRLLWALGGLVEAGLRGPQREAAKVMFDRALPMADALIDLRPIACGILGLCAYLQRQQSLQVRTSLELLAARLFRGFEASSAADWPWPESQLTYENARLPQAMLAAGRTLADDGLVQQGLTSLRWLMEVQTENGHFAPIGNDGWYARGGEPARFDQQPIEADATMAACLEAFRADEDPRWLDAANSAFNWFLGDNAIGKPLCVPETGGCRDGLEVDGVNGNQGAESTLAWLSSQINMHALTVLAPLSGVGAR
jgi:hypothetical protein